MWTFAPFSQLIFWIRRLLFSCWEEHQSFTQIPDVLLFYSLIIFLTWDSSVWLRYQDEIFLFLIREVCARAPARERFPGGGVGCIWENITWANAGATARLWKGDFRHTQQPTTYFSYWKKIIPPPQNGVTVCMVYNGSPTWGAVVTLNSWRFTWAKQVTLFANHGETKRTWDSSEFRMYCFNYSSRHTKVACMCILLHIIGYHICKYHK